MALAPAARHRDRPWAASWRHWAPPTLPSCLVRVVGPKVLPAAGGPLVAVVGVGRHRGVSLSKEPFLPGGHHVVGVDALRAGGRVGGWTERVAGSGWAGPARTLEPSSDLWVDCGPPTLRYEASSPCQESIAWAPQYLQRGSLSRFQLGWGSGCVEVGAGVVTHGGMLSVRAPQLSAQPALKRGWQHALLPPPLALQLPQPALPPSSACLKIAGSSRYSRPVMELRRLTTALMNCLTWGGARVGQGQGRAGQGGRDGRRA